jgi:hypothetical protein
LENRTGTADSLHHKLETETRVLFARFIQGAFMFTKFMLLVLMFVCGFAK